MNFILVFYEGNLMWFVGFGLVNIVVRNFEVVWHQKTLVKYL
jgi:hypothetical protein